MKYLLIISLVCIILGALLAFLLLLRKSKNRKRLTILFIIIFVFVGVFYGYGFYKVNSETMKEAQTIDKKANLLLKYNMLKDDNVFTAYPNRDGSTRYYYSIDGKLSNIFVDIEENENGIVALRGNLDELDVNKLKVLKIKDIYYKDGGEIVYNIEDNISTPILMEEIKDKGVYQIKCTNLNNGEDVKYEDIAYWEE